MRRTENLADQANIFVRGRKWKSMDYWQHFFLIESKHLFQDITELWEESVPTGMWRSTIEKDLEVISWWAKGMEVDVMSTSPCKCFDVSDMGTEHGSFRCNPLDRFCALYLSAKFPIIHKAFARPLSLIRTKSLHKSFYRASSCVFCR